jgi:single-stranded DNA-binding protein
MREYEENQGVKRTVAEIISSDIEFLSSRSGESYGNADSSQNLGAKTAKYPQLEIIDDDEDIPF